MSYSIYKKVLESIMGFSKAIYPREFSGLLVGTSELIEDIYILPGTKSYTNSATLRLDLAPLSFRLIGSVHSHPSGSGNASLADLNFFSRKYVNIISYYPFSLYDFKAYDNKGNKIQLKVI